MTQNLVRWFLVTSSLAAAGCGKPSGPGGFAMPPAAVVVAPAVAQDVPRFLDEIGRCVARESVSVQPQVSGRLTEIHFADGADVKAGDPLFTIDPRPYQAQLAASEAALAQEKAALQLAQSDFARAKTLLEKSAIAQQEFDTIRNTVEVSGAKVKQSQAALDTARLNLEYCSIRSPIEGRTGHRLVDIGNIVTANSGSLLLIQRINPIYADFSVDEHELAAVQKSMARGPVEVEVSVPGELDPPRKGELSFLDNAVQDGTGTVALRATLQNPDRLFWPGRFVRVRLILSTIKGAVLVPTDATQMSAKGPYVYLIKDDLSAQLQPVKLGQRQGKEIVIEEGVRPGDRVVTVGHFRVMPGGKVKIEGPKGADAVSSKGMEK